MSYSYLNFANILTKTPKILVSGVGKIGREAIEYMLSKSSLDIDFAIVDIELPEIAHPQLVGVQVGRRNIYEVDKNKFEIGKTFGRNSSDSLHRLVRNYDLVIILGDCKDNLIFGITSELVQ